MFFKWYFIFKTAFYIYYIFIKQKDMPMYANFNNLY